MASFASEWLQGKVIAGTETGNAAGELSLQPSEQIIAKWRPP
jgi:hypothetical protein